MHPVLFGDTSRRSLGMKTVVMVLACALSLASAGALFAGPFMSVPTVLAEGDEYAPGTEIEQISGVTVAVGMGQFTFRSLLPEIRALGVGTRGGAWDGDAGCYAIAAEGYKLLDPGKGSLLRFGGWYARPFNLGGGQSSECLAELHLGYRFTESAGVELGQFVADAADVIGKTALHITYDMPQVGESGFALQFGAGWISETDTFVLPGAPNMDRETDFSAYANASYSLPNDYTLTGNLWFLRQRLSMPAFALGSTAVPAISSTKNSVNWGLAIGKEF
jgi:hypothetical protein